MRSGEKRRNGQIWLLAAWICMALLWTEQEAAAASAEEEDETYQEELLLDLDTDQIQKMMDQLLKEDSFSFLHVLKELMKGEQPFSWEELQKTLERALTGQFEASRSVFGQVLLLAFAGAVLASLIQIFDREQMGDLCFYLIYLLVFVLLLKEFGRISQEIHKILEGIVNFMRALTPSYYLVMTAAAGMTSAIMFYQIIMVVIFGVEYLLMAVLVPAVHVYILLEFMNLMTKEGLLSRIAELLKSGILWAQRSLLAVIIGMQVIQGLVAPAVDSLKRSLLGKTVSVIPGVGNAFNTVTEIIFGSAVLIRNCFGATVLIVLIVMSLSPVLKLLINAAVYKLTAAVIQPVCDGRLVGCFHAMGEGCGLLLKLLFTAQILFMLTVVLLSNSL